MVTFGEWFRNRLLGIGVSQNWSSNLTLTGNDSIWHCAVLLTDSSQVNITNVHVSEARSRNGSAIYAISSTVHLYGNISFVSNTGICYSYELGCGDGIQLYDSTAVFSGNITFRDNSATHSLTRGALCIYKSNVTISGYMMFAKNKALHGGAVFVYYSNVSYNTSGRINFVNNTASSFGGAVGIMFSSQKMYGNISFFQ